MISQEADTSAIFATLFIEITNRVRYDNPLTNKGAGKNNFAAAESNELR